MTRYVLLKHTVVALDLPTSHMLMKADPVTKDEVDFTTQMLNAINSTMLDMLSAISRKDYLDRRRRQKQGIEAARAIPGKYAGRKPDDERNASIIKLLEDGKLSWTEICKVTRCSRSTLARLNKLRLEAAQQ